MNYDIPKKIETNLINIQRFCERQLEKPLGCTFEEIKKYSFASLASIARFVNFSETIKVKDSFEAILRDKDGNIKETRKQ